MKKNIESQHQSIHARIAALYDFCFCNSSKLDCHDCLKSDKDANACLDFVLNEMNCIISEIADHFSHEEGCMLSSDFHKTNAGLFEEHLKDHAEIIRKCDGLVNNSGHISASAIIKSLLMDMLSRVEHHINIHDQQFLAVLAA